MLLHTFHFLRSGIPVFAACVTFFLTFAFQITIEMFNNSVHGDFIQNIIVTITPALRTSDNNFLQFLLISLVFLEWSMTFPVTAISAATTIEKWKYDCSFLKALCQSSGPWQRSGCSGITVPNSLLLTIKTLTEMLKASTAVHAIINLAPILQNNDRSSQKLSLSGANIWV